ncbi:MAG: ABC transporter ATP-binding protein [Clostridia bacterium]
MIIEHKKLLSYYIKLTFKSILLATIILVAISGLNVFQPQIGSQIVKILGATKADTAVRLLVKYSLIYFIVGLGITILEYIKNVVLERIYKNTTRKLRVDILETVANFKYEKTNRFDVGFLYSRIANSTERLSTIFSITIPTLLGNSIFLVLVVLAIAIESATFAIILSAAIIISFLVMSFLIFYGRTYLSKSNRNGLKRHGHYIETLNGLKQIKIHRMTKKFFEKLQDITKKEYKFAMQSVVINSSVNSFITLGENFAIALLIIIGIKQIGSIELDIAQIYLLITYIRKVFEPIYEIVDQFDKMQKSISSYIGIKKVLDFEPQLNIETAQTEFTEDIKIIEFDNVSYSFNKETDALKNATFKIRAKERVGLTGEVGKHTIVDLLYKLYLPKNGHIKINGKSLRKISSKSMRDKITIIDQDPEIFKGTLEDNIALYDKNLDKAKLEEILVKTKLNKYIDNKTQIEENGKNLSTGERQLISLARCMYKGGEIFVWNETTSLLDAQTQATMNKIINKMTEDKTLLIIAHRPATIKTCNRILNVTTDGVKEIKEV